MIIVSQDKDVIVNFDRTQNIWIDDDVLDKTNTSFDIVADEQTIGTYATEERAKEVLNGIIRAYEKAGNLAFEINEGEDEARLIHNSNVFEMPKE